MKRLITISIMAMILGFSTIVADTDNKDRRISLELEDVSIISVLNMIASQNSLNVVIAGDIDGKVSLRLEDVDIPTALDAIITANGYNYFIKNDVIIVKIPSTDKVAGEMESRLVILKYLDPITAEKALFPLLSEKGKVVILDKTRGESEVDRSYSANRILVTDYPNVLDMLVATVLEIDQPERSLLIEAKIIETTVDTKINLGFTWPTSLNTDLSNATIGTSNTGTGTATTTNSGAGIYDPNNGKWIWGKLTVQQVAIVLNALQKDGNSRLISDPRITTLENHTAEFKFNTIIPIQTINRFTEGSATSDIVTFEDQEVGISLIVTPRINEGDRITLDVIPTVEDIIGFNGPSGNQKPITASRSIKTKITVNDGETIALGGLLKESDIETVNKVPLLGSIPLLGKLLFSNKSTEKKTTDLIILITPHIIQ